LGSRPGYDFLLADGTLSEVDEPVPALAETYGVDARGRRYSRMLGGVVQEYYAYEGQDRVAVVGRNGADANGFGIAGPVLESYLFDGIDHPLRIARPGPVTTAYYYYELDLAGNVRGLRASGGASLGGYRYSAFGQALEDTTSITQPLRWKGRWFSPVAGGTYDVRARQWSPELGIFLSVDEFEYQDANSTLWGWGNQNPVRFMDPTGNDVYECTRWTWGSGGSTGPIPHQYNCVLTATVTSCYGHGGTPGADKFDPKRCKLKHKNNACMDQCMLAAFLGARDDYSFFTNNCIQWSDNKMRQCRTKCGLADDDALGGPLGGP
jgi:RHS repeat-associated protein